MLDRVRLATVETIEAMLVWNESEMERKQDTPTGALDQEQNGFIWHTKNYMLELLTDMDRTIPSSSTEEGRRFQAHVIRSLGFDLKRNPFALPLKRKSDEIDIEVAMTIGNDLITMGNGGYIYVPGRNYDIEIARLEKCEQALLNEESKAKGKDCLSNRLIPAFVSNDVIDGITSLNKSMEKYRNFRSLKSDSENEGDDQTPTKRRRRGKKKRKKYRASHSPSASTAASTASPTNRSSTKKKNKKKSPTVIKSSITPGSWRMEEKQDIPDPSIAEELKKEGMKQWERIFGLRDSEDDEQNEEEEMILVEADEEIAFSSSQKKSPKNKRTTLKDSPSSSNKRHHGEWKRYFDDASASFYFHHTTTDKSTWVRPQGWKTPMRGERAPLPSVPNDETTDWIDLAKKSPMKRRRGVWSEHLDQDSGAYWYHNGETGQSTSSTI